MPTIEDDEFGTIKVHRSNLATYVRIKISQNGDLRASLPKRAPLKLVTQLLNQSRDELRRVVNEQKAKMTIFEHDMEIGKSHRLHIEYANVSVPQRVVTGQKVMVQLPQDTPVAGTGAQNFIRKAVLDTLKKQAKAFLPRRVRYLAELYGFSVDTVRFNNAKTRWGSCSSRGSINLNVALMQLPYELIDYVIVHELAHTKYLDHSEDFWELVGYMDPEYKLHRRTLKQYHPYI
jgi:predicted metal-dependent hydrolase